MLDTKTDTLAGDDTRYRDTVSPLEDDGDPGRRLSQTLQGL